MAMRRNKVHEFEADVPAAELWGLYGTLRAAELLPELLPQVLAKIQLVSGDGDVGTILELTFAPGQISRNHPSILNSYAFKKKILKSSMCILTE